MIPDFRKLGARAKCLFGQQCIDEYQVKVASNVEEAAKLKGVGFEYVTGDYGDGGKIFRKRKWQN